MKEFDNINGEYYVCDSKSRNDIESLNSQLNQLGMTIANIKPYIFNLNDDYRYILNSDPILNDYSKVNITNNTQFRYVSLGQDIEQITKSIQCFKSDNYYKNLIENEFWKNSYECNLLEGKE